MKINQEKIFPALWRDAGMYFGSGEETNTLRIQQTWGRRFTILYFKNKITMLSLRMYKANIMQNPSSMLLR